MILTVGVVLSVWEGTIEGAVGGIAIAVASVLAGAAMLNFSGKYVAPHPFCQAILAQQGC